ncbi:MAG TPA: 50S ribosomal protein L21 [Xanthomarina sp.]|nr:50S ribosomal protein L21 [Xanthomarina sp.]
MYAIVEIAGHQFKVEKDQRVFVNRLATEEGKQVSFDNVLLVADGDKVTVGAPAINGAQVGAKVLKHLKGDKVIVFKKKRRKGYRVKNGHRQSLTEIVIESIVASGAKPAAQAKKEAPKAAPKKSTAKADDLKKIEGAGPKAAEALVNAGYDTFAKVAKATPEELSTVLTEASSRLAHIVTETWPKQAQLAADGKWDELKELQDKLDGGIEK